MVTRNGIYYKLEDSPYCFTVEDMTYIFSSKSHLLKFKDRYKAHREKLNASLSNRFDIPVDLGCLADVILYTKVESRGFFIKTEAGESIWQKRQVSNGLKIRKRSLTGQ